MLRGVPILDVCQVRFNWGFYSNAIIFLESFSRRMDGEMIEMTTFKKSISDPEADPEIVESNEKNKELGEKVEKKWV